MVSSVLTPTDHKHHNFTDAIAKKQLGELDLALGFSANFFMMFGLPTRKLPAGQQTIIKENPLYQFVVTQMNPKYDIPYGCFIVSVKKYTKRQKIYPSRKKHVKEPKK